jgi:hypothetical protein
LAAQSQINQGIHNPGNTFSNYPESHRWAPIGGTVPAGVEAYWGETGLDYVVTRETYVLANTNGIGSLTIAPGQNILFKAASLMLLGSLNARGTELEPITFASYPGEGPTGGIANYNTVGSLFRGSLCFEHCVFDGLLNGIRIYDLNRASLLPGDDIRLEVRSCVFKNIILELAGKGLVSGYPDGTFKPDKKITRAEVTAVLARALKLAPGQEEDLKFADSAAIPTWAKGVVAAAAKEGLVRGYPQPDGSVIFEAGRPVSRVEMVAFAMRILERKTGTVVPAELEFTDLGAIPDWARASVAAAVAKGIAAGYPDGTFRPERPVTRAEAAAIIYRLFNALDNT